MLDLPNIKVCLSKGARRPTLQVSACEHCLDIKLRAPFERHTFMFGKSNIRIGCLQAQIVLGWDTPWEHLQAQNDRVTIFVFNPSKSVGCYCEHSVKYRKWLQVLVSYQFSGLTVVYKCYVQYTTATPQVLGEVKNLCL
jgi:hypothetical protein